jgi:hypothetical protein
MGFPLFPARGLQNPYGSLWVEIRSSILVDLFALDGFIGGTRFEVDYAVNLGIPVQTHRGNRLSRWIF